MHILSTSGKDSPPITFPRKSDGGFIALISVLIIGAILLVTIVAASFINFYSRYNVLDFEFKERSVSAADACADRALLELANNPAYAGGLTASLNSLDACRVGNVQQNTPAAGQVSFKIQATSSDAVTNLSITVNASDLSVISWREIPTF